MPRRAKLRALCDMDVVHLRADVHLAELVDGVAPVGGALDAGV